MTAFIRLNGARPKARARPKKPLPDCIDSKAEHAVLLKLEADLKAGAIRSYYVKPGSFRTGKGVSYHPDFLVVYLDGSIEYIEVKGKTRFAATSVPKAKMVAHMYPDFVFVILWAKEIKGKKAHLPLDLQYEFTREELFP